VPPMSTAAKLFKRAAPFLDLIDDITPIAATHEYKFLSDEWFSEWMSSAAFTVERCNNIIALELIEKAHLASVSALLRAKRWADATCLMYEKENFVGWAASFRGLLESAGDTYDGLARIPAALALHHRGISLCLAGKEQNWVGAKELEDALDHFVHAKWTRAKKGDVLKAKENIDYVTALQRVIPEVEKLYHRLCSICHPSNASIEYFNEPSLNSTGGFKISPTRDMKAISRFDSEFPNALQDALMMHSNPPLLILRVLHAFDVHPQLKALRKYDLKQISGGAEIQRLLKN
jgi:hypothetical protein